MSTHSRIGIKNEDNTVTSVYCHFDGYINGVGAVLNQYYNTEESIRKIISLGNLSSLDKNIEPTEDNHSYENPQSGVCIFYGRDYGDVDEDAITYPNEESYLESCRLSYVDYCYLFKDGQWYVHKYYGEDLSLLSEELIKV